MKIFFLVSQEQKDLNMGEPYYIFVNGTAGFVVIRHPEQK